MGSADDLRAVLDHLGEAVALFDTEDRLILHNAAVLRLFPCLGSLGDLPGLSYSVLAAAPYGPASLAEDREAYLEARLAHHRRADGTAFDVPLEGGGWAEVRERRLPDGRILSRWSDANARKAAESRVLATFDALGEAVVEIDGEGRVVLVNAAMSALFAQVGVRLSPGASLLEAVGAAHAAGLFAPTARRAAVLAGIRQLETQPDTRLEVELRDGACLLISTRPTCSGGIVAILTDMTAQKRREKELLLMREQLGQQAEALSNFAQLLARQIRHDLLTGLPNRLALDERLGQLLANSEEDRVWVGFLDLDHFKTVNEKIGHATADALLRDISAYLRRQLRGDDMLVRVGGDSFAVLAVGPEEAEMRAIAERLVASIHAHPFLVDGQSCRLTISMGVARRSAGDASPVALLVNADTACRVAKESGRNRVQFYDAGDPQVSDRKVHLGWADRLHGALEFDRLALEFQAIVGKDGAVHGYEALLRLVDETGLTHSPSSFLPAARRLGMMRRIDDWVSRRVFAYAARLKLRNSGTYLAMNLGTRSLADPEFQRQLMRQLDANPGIGPWLRIEVTETDAIENVAAISQFLGRLRRRGLRIYLDDFGSGYNSFEVLKHLPIDGIKTDWTVTRDLLEDPIDEALMRAAISIARSLGIEMVAEGVESRDQLDRLVSLGAEQFQGYLFHRPEPAEAVLG